MVDSLCLSLLSACLLVNTFAVCLYIREYLSCWKKPPTPTSGKWRPFQSSLPLHQPEGVCVWRTTAAAKMYYHKFAFYLMAYVSPYFGCITVNPLLLGQIIKTLLRRQMLPFFLLFFPSFYFLNLFFFTNLIHQ